LHSQQHAGLIPAHNDKRPSTPESSTSHSPSLSGFENRSGSLKVLRRASAPESKAGRFFGCRTRIGVEPWQNESVRQRAGGSCLACSNPRLMVPRLYSWDHPDVPKPPLKIRHLGTVRQLPFLTTQPFASAQPHFRLSFPHESCPTSHR
jgi:hypothetical protein